MNRWIASTSSCCEHPLSLILGHRYLVTPSRAMAQKESQHNELVSSLTDQLTQVRRAHDGLVTLSRDQVYSSFVKRFVSI